MDFEELALKGVDPSLAPPLRNPGTTGKQLTSVSQSDDKVQQRHQEVRIFLGYAYHKLLIVAIRYPSFIHHLHIRSYSCRH